MFGQIMFGELLGPVIESVGALYGNHFVRLSVQTLSKLILQKLSTSRLRTSYTNGRQKKRNTPIDFGGQNVEGHTDIFCHTFCM